MRSRKTVVRWNVKTVFTMFDMEKMSKVSISVSIYSIYSPPTYRLYINPYRYPVFRILSSLLYELKYTIQLTQFPTGPLIIL